MYDAESVELPDRLHDRKKKISGIRINRDRTVFTDVRIKRDPVFPFVDKIGGPVFAERPKAADDPAFFFPCQLAKRLSFFFKALHAAQIPGLIERTDRKAVRLPFCKVFGVIFFQKHLAIRVSRKIPDPVFLFIDRSFNEIGILKARSFR